MIKRIIWIDDSELLMKNVVSDVFVKLWEGNIKSEIFIMGDYDLKKKKYNRSEAISDLNSVIYDKFISFLIDKDYIEKESMVRKKWFLINSDEEISTNSNVATNKEGILEKYNDIITSWKECRGNIRKTEIQSDKFSVKKIANGIIDDIREVSDNIEDILIMLDLCLLFDDYIKLTNQNENMNNQYKDCKNESGGIITPIFSMALYDELVKILSKDKVLLYSTFVFPDDIVKNWIKTYKKYYVCDHIINIYDRFGNPTCNEACSETKALSLFDYCQLRSDDK